MAGIIHTRWGGLVPRLDPGALPHNGATLAHNVDLTTGMLRPIKVLDPFSDLHDDTGKLRSELRETDIVSVPKPATECVVSKFRMCKPWRGIGELWLDMEAYTYVTYVDNNGDFQGDQIHFNDLLWNHLTYTPDGFVARFYTQTPIDFDAHWGTVYTVRGPVYKMLLTADTGFNGGPDAALNYPPSISYASPNYPQVAIPLTYPLSFDTYGAGGPVTAANRYQYATLQLIDVNGPKMDGEQFFRDRDSEGVTKKWSDGTYHVNIINACYIDFVFRVNYIRDAPVRAYYLLTAVDEQVADTEREGPPCDIADVATMVEPGEAVMVSGPICGSCDKYRFYRSETGGDDFRLLQEVETDGDTVPAPLFYDDFTKPLTESLPPFGNYPQASLPLAMENSVVHPTQFAILKHGCDIRPSDFYRLWAYPEEYAVTFATEVLAQVVAGGSVIVFTAADETTGEQGKVFIIQGGDPGRLMPYQVSEIAPLLSVSSVCRLDTTVFYASEDGLCALGGGTPPQSVTRDLYRREAWQELDPETMVAQVNDRSIFLTCGNGSILRVDIGEYAKLSTCDAYSNVPFEWQSKVFDFGRAVAFGWLQIEADAYPVTFKLIDADKKMAVAQVAVRSDTPVRLPILRAERRWQYFVSGRGTVKKVAMASNAIELRGSADGP
jgi:hypothetical protein